MVSGRVLIRLVHGALEHDAVHSACATLVAANGDGYRVPTFEAVVMAHVVEANAIAQSGKRQVSAEIQLFTAYPKGPWGAPGALNIRVK